MVGPLTPWSLRLHHGCLAAFSVILCWALWTWGTGIRVRPGVLLGPLCALTEPHLRSGPLTPKPQLLVSPDSPPHCRRHRQERCNGPWGQTQQMCERHCLGPPPPLCVITWPGPQQRHTQRYTAMFRETNPARPPLSIPPTPSASGLQAASLPSIPPDLPVLTASPRCWGVALGRGVPLPAAPRLSQVLDSRLSLHSPCASD